MMSQQVDQIREGPIWYQCVDLKTEKLMLFKLMLLQCCHIKLFHGGGPYHIETGPLICSENDRDLRHERVKASVLLYKNQSIDIVVKCKRLWWFYV